MTQRFKFLVASSAIFALFLDQLSKYFSSLAQVNTGVAFGLLADSFFSVKLASLFFFAVTIFIVWQFWSNWQKIPVALGMFMGGVFGNLLDRLVYGGVRDWLTLPFINLTNNLADWFIFISLSWLTMQIIGERRRAK
ncbi:MAG: hypothetical protein COU65_01545 [Candidatus Pacebacteria bacterium CG10_big_fil_rev_8_21_14_0_10_42_12]|nr:signal peptidase II [Candidatus Paceibacterota bacterium]PIR62797.1 MAG: hypothetical protein COU65_01545 [Candidatus Pacebacteria bacterium CG10_big_fil_rev_8_21_14_0_10_42_12]